MNGTGWPDHDGEQSPVVAQLRLEVNRLALEQLEMHEQLAKLLAAHEEVEEVEDLDRSDVPEVHMLSRSLMTPYPASPAGNPGKLSQGLGRLMTAADSR